MYASISFVWRGDTIIGYCNTLAEADYICTIDPDLNWSYSEENQDIKGINLLTIYDFNKKK